MGEPKRYKISVLGETIRLLSDDKDEYMLKVINHVEKTMSKLNNSKAMADLTNAEKFLYGTVYLTDQLFSENNEAQKIMKENEILTNENYLLKQNLAKLQKELESTQKQFNEFLTDFDK